ncbi:MAG TPA: hypothetical protein PK280_17175 [Planctomycetota bacterium]|nr:hypothetical protein [Planctomycetota bacterium]
MTSRLTLATALITALAGCAPRQAPARAAAPWHRNILATVFWVGEPGNEASAWDAQWVRSFGGVDDPKRRDGFLPAGFTPKLNPFYCALPYNDVAGRPGAKSALRGRWVEVRAGGRSCFCQVEDVGPWYVDDRDYVLGECRPRAEGQGRAGIDLSPAVRDYLKLSGKDLVDWRFADAAPAGPWSGWGP